MIRLIQDLKKFIAQYSILFWLVMFVFLTTTLAISEFYKVQLSIFKLKGIHSFLAYFALYALHFMSAFFFVSLFSKDFKWVKTRQFWVLIVVGISLFSLRSVLTFYGEVVELFAVPGRIGISKLIFSDLIRLLFLLMMLRVVWLFYRVPQHSFYGFSAKQVEWLLYFKMLLFMLPLITAASFMGDFLEYYPRASRIDIYHPEPHHYFWFEVVYALDFISIEVFFRGFMILAFLKILGPKAIIPTAAFYFSIHFGKPIGETISSFFGGVLLGYLSYKTQSIWGGVLVHIGIALLMELGAFIGLMLI